MSRLVAMVLGLLLGSHTAAGKRFDDARFPFVFEYADSLHLESHAAKRGQQAMLRDWSADDNYRAFLIMVSAKRVDKGVSLDTAADAWLTGRRKASAYRNITVTARKRSTHGKRPALVLEVHYTYAGGRETFTRPDGEERHTEEGALPMVAHVVFLRHGARLVRALLDVSKAQEPRRRAQLRRVLRTVTLR